MSTELITGETTTQERVARIRENQKRLNSAGNEMVRAAIAMGEDLIAMKEKLGHGCFLPWLEATFVDDTGDSTLSQQHANRFMRLAANYSRVSNLRHATTIREALEMIKAAERKEPEPDEESEQGEAVEKTLREAVEVLAGTGEVLRDTVCETMGTSLKTKTADAALKAVADIGNNYAVETAKASKGRTAYVITKRPEKKEAILQEFAKLTPKEKMAMMRRLHLDEDVARINDKKQVQRMKTGGNPNQKAYEAARSHIEQAGHFLHAYASHYGHDFRWLSKAMQSEEGTKEVLSLIAILEGLADSANKYADELNRRTQDV